MRKSSVFAACLAALAAAAAPAAAQLPRQSLLAPKSVGAGAAPVYLASAAGGQTILATTRSGSGNSTQGALRSFNADSMTAGATVPLGPGFVFSVAVDPAGSRAYVAVSKQVQSFTSPGANRIEVIDLASATALAPISLPETRADTIVLTPNGQRLYVSDRSSNKVYAIDTATQALVATIAVGNSPSGMAITPDGSRIYVGSAISSAMSVIDTATNTVTASILHGLAVANATTHVAVSHDGRLAYMTSAPDNEIAVIDSDPASPTYNLRLRKVAVRCAATLNDVAVSDDDSLLYATSFDADAVIAVDARGDLLDPLQGQARMPLGSGADPFGVVAGGSLGSVAYSANLSGASISRVGLDDEALGRVRGVLSQAACL